MIFNSMDKLYESLLDDVNNYPDFVCKPRGFNISEILGCTLCLTNPRSRIVGNVSRKVNYSFACAEFLWYWAGKNDLATVNFYNKKIADFSDDGRTLNSCYGLLMKGHSGAHVAPFSSEATNRVQLYNQWSNVVETLKSDPDSRRAIIQIYQPAHGEIAASIGTKDVPCTLSLQFFIRDKSLHLFTTMRSNDVVWGIPYDVFSFTMLQECMLLELRAAGLDIDLGRYIHTANSMHIYENHSELVEATLNEYSTKSVNEILTGEIDSLYNLNMLCRDEERLRNEGVLIDERQYVGTLRWMAEQLNRKVAAK